MDSDASGEYSGLARRLPRGIALALLGLALLTGCAQTGPTPIGKPSELTLEAWVESDLSPYLSRELATHPRFRNAPILLVGLSGSTVRSELDRLSGDIRDRLLDALLPTPGLKVVVPVTATPPRHHRSLESVDCRNHSEVHYFLGIETRIEGDTLRVAVRALDRQDGSWVSGFGKAWRGRLTAAQRRALGQRRADEHLRGLRTLPFEATQTDLMALYLANNLSCLLSQSGGEEMLLYTDSGASAAPVMSKTLPLVENYLARFREVRITARLQDANYVLSGELHPLGAGLYQAWTMVATKDGAEYLPGLGTETYLHLERAGSDLDAGLESSAAVSTRAFSDGDRDDPLLIRSVRLRLVKDPVRCARNTASWQSGGRSEMALAPCHVVEMQAGGNARIHLLKVDERGNLLRVPVSGCGASSQASRRVAAGEWARLPTGAMSPRPSPSASSAQTLYVIATGSVPTARALARHLRVLETDCPGSLPGAVTRASSAAWLDAFEALVTRHRSQLQWRALRLPQRGVRSPATWLSSGVY